MEGRSPGAAVSGRGVLLKGHGLLVWNDVNVLEINGGDSGQQCERTQLTKLCNYVNYVNIV